MRIHFDIEPHKCKVQTTPLEATTTSTTRKLRKAESQKFGAQNAHSAALRSLLRRCDHQDHLPSRGSTDPQEERPMGLP